MKDLVRNCMNRGLNIQCQVDVCYQVNLSNSC